MSATESDILTEDVEVTFLFRWSAISTMFILSFLGSLINCTLFIKFLTKKGTYTGFEKLCIAKTIPNIIVSLAVLCWAVPISVLSISYDEVPLEINRSIGIISGTGAYTFGPIIQTFMAFNRFFVLYFPFRVMKMERSPVLKIAITSAFIFSSCICIPSIPDLCAYVYDPDYYAWRPEDSACGEWNNFFIFYILIGLSCTSNMFNIMMVSKLLVEKIGGAAPGYASKRKKKWLLMFTQSVIQDCMHVIDIINTIYTYKLSDELWFQFIFLSASFSFIYTFDGIIMLYFHQDIQPNCLRRILQNKATSKSTFMTNSGIVTFK